MAEKKNRTYTVLVVPDSAAAARQYRVPARLVRQVVWSAVLFVIALGGAVGGGWYLYYDTVDEASEARALKDENLYLRSELRLVQEKVAHISSSLDRVERLDAKIRLLTQINDPDRNLAIGPVREPESLGVVQAMGDLPALGEADGLATDEDIQLVHARLDNLGAEARREEGSLRELHEYLVDQKEILASMPSIWPARGWLTSTFGSRHDPFTADRTMHKGLDIAAAIGTEVKAPANGAVVFAGAHGAYGKVLVIDHGNGVKTRYAHLSEIFVKVGDQVTRRQVVAAIGNTGRSTGPHLHYEVRVNGIPEDPKKFILD